MPRREHRADLLLAHTPPGATVAGVKDLPEVLEIDGWRVPASAVVDMVYPAPGGHVTLRVAGERTVAVFVTTGDAPVVVKAPPPDPCDACDGTGEGPDGNACIACLGTGNER